MTNEKFERMTETIIKYQRRVDQLTAENNRLRVQLRANQQQQQEKLSFEPSVGEPGYDYSGQGKHDMKVYQEHAGRYERDQSYNNCGRELTANLAKTGGTYEFEKAPGDVGFEYSTTEKEAA